MSYWSRGYHHWAPRKSVTARRADAARQIKDAERRGQAMSPVTIAGRKIAHTFWGKAWCDNLERYRDFAYRLERGRSYVRSGSVLDLRIEAGKIVAKVSGSSLYDVAIEIDAVQRDAWRAIQRDCAGGIGSRLDLLGGRLSEPVMARLCADRTGMFPAPSAIRFTCSCPDYATMCKHVAAAMYGVGARLDHAPELLFTLRRDGTVSGVRITQKSGIAALDISAQRAIMDAAPFPQLPPQFPKNEAEIEFLFQLKQ
jgi:TonB family protein